MIYVNEKFRVGVMLDKNILSSPFLLLYLILNHNEMEFLFFLPRIGMINKVRLIKMFYNIAGIVLGLLLLLNSYIAFRISKEKLSVLIIGIFFSLGLVGSGIGGFFMPENLSYIPILLLLVFSIGYLIFYYLVLKENKKSQQGKINPRK